MAYKAKVSDMLVALAAALRATWDTEADNDPDFPNIGFCEVVPGQGVVPSYAFGDDCGLLWVRLIQIYPATGLGQPAQGYDGCGTLIGADIELGVGRCVPGYDPNNPGSGEPPDPELLTEVSVLNAQDALLMVKAVKCTGFSPKDYRLGTYIPYGPQGYLGGGVWMLSVLVT